MLKGILNKLVGDAGNIIDNVVTTKEEKMKLKNEMKKMLLDSENDLQRNVTDRWKADMSSDSWLSKNVRPMTLIFVLVCTMLLIFIDAGTIEFHVEEKWTDLLQIVLITIVGSYFGGRSIEKLKSNNKNK
jgi:cation transport ATPase|tara:strand:- start:4609 stop:4998 length:390 start_codon:yes stop_codon:yes gene_type:complete